MPIIDLLFSFTKKNKQVLSAFMDAWKNIRDAKNIPLNLERMYECIAYEHSKQITYNCTEYFIEKELFPSILKLSKMGYKKDVSNFLIKLISELDKKNLSELQPSIDSIFSECSVEHLGICLAYSERIVVHDLDIDESYVDYILRFAFIGGVEGEYARACLIYLLSSEKIEEILENKGFIVKAINSLNYLYDDIHYNIELYKIIVELVCLYLIKDSSNKRKVNSKTIGYKIDESETKRNYTCVSYKNQIASKNIHRPAEDINCDKKRILRTLNVGFKDIEMYKQILESSVLYEINRLIIEEFINNMENNEEHIEFIKYLIKKHSSCLSSYFFTFECNEWCVHDVFDKIISNCRDTKPIPFTFKKLHMHSDRSMIDKIIALRIKDEDIYLFMFLVSKESFFSRFYDIFELMKTSNTFFGTLYRLIVE